MNHRFLAAALTAAALALTATAGDTPKTPDPAPAPPTAAVPLKGTLPAHYKQLGLSDVQRQKAYAVTAAAKEKLAKLEAEIAAVKDDEHKQLDALLTDEQRTHLAALPTGNKTDAKK